jgi:hypothetical protein
MSPVETVWKATSTTGGVAAVYDVNSDTSIVIGVDNMSFPVVELLICTVGKPDELTVETNAAARTNNRPFKSSGIAQKNAPSATAPASASPNTLIS